jgi:acyl carrier protein
MTSLDLVKKALQTECGVDPGTINEQTDLLNDLRVDSLDLLNASFLIEKDCGVALPVQEWLAEEYGENTTNVRRFTVSEICAYIDREMSRLQKQVTPRR